MAASKKLSSGAARQVLRSSSTRAATRPRSPSRRPRPGGEDELAAIVESALEADPDAAAQVREGNMKAVGPLVGFVMRETKGRADGGEVTKLIQHSDSRT